MVGRAGLEGFTEAFCKIGLFGVAEDAAREAWEVVWLGQEAGDSRDVDDIGANIEREWEREGFHIGESVRGLVKVASENGL